MWNCNFVRTLIEDVNRWFLFHNINITFNKTTSIFGETAWVRKGDPYNIIYLCIKQCIYNTRCFKKSLSSQALQEKLKDMYNIEKNWYLLKTNVLTSSVKHGIFMKAYCIDLILYFDYFITLNKTWIGQSIISY